MPPPRRIITILPEYRGDLSVLPTNLGSLLPPIVIAKTQGDPYEDVDSSSPAIPDLNIIAFDGIPTADVKDYAPGFTRYQRPGVILTYNNFQEEEDRLPPNFPKTNFSELPPPNLKYLLSLDKRGEQEEEKLKSKVNFDDTPKDPNYRGVLPPHTNTLGLKRWDPAILLRSTDYKTFSYNDRLKIVDALSKIYDRLDHGCLNSLKGINSDLDNLINNLQNFFTDPKKTNPPIVLSQKSPLTDNQGNRTVAYSSWPSNEATNNSPGSIEIDWNFLQQEAIRNNVPVEQYLFSTLLHELVHQAGETGRELDARVLEFACNYTQPKTPYPPSGTFTEYNYDDVRDDTYEYFFAQDILTPKLGLWPIVASSFFVVDVCTGEVFDKNTYANFLNNIAPKPPPVNKFNNSYQGTYIDSSGKVRRGYKDPTTGKEHRC